MGKRTMTKILHLLRDGPSDEVLEIIKAQSEGHEVEIYDLTEPGVVYDELIDKIEACDKVISW